MKPGQTSVPNPTSARPSKALPAILTLEEAVRLTNISRDALWEAIRAGRIPFTLVSGRSDAGILINGEDLVRFGIATDSMTEHVRVLGTRSQGRSPMAPRARSSAKRNVSAIRVGAYSGTAVAGALALVLIALLVAAFIGRRAARPAASGPANAPRRPGCEARATQRGCPQRGSVSSTRTTRSPAKLTTGSTTRSPSLVSGPNGTRSGTGAVGLQPVPGSRDSSPGLQGSSGLSGQGSAGNFSPPPSVPSNCSRDVTKDLNAWINTIPDHSVLLFPMGSCYRIDHTLRIANRAGLTFSGNGTTLNGKYHTEGKLPHVGVYTSRDITFEHITVRGANPRAGLREDAYVSGLQWEAAWDIEGSQGIALDSVQAYDLYGDFVLIQPRWAIPPINSRDVAIRNSHFERNGRQGIAITGAVNVTISNNYIGKVRHSLLDLEPEWESLPIDNVRFTNNKTGGVYLLWIANAGKCNVGVSNIYVTDNVMASDAGIPLFHSFPPAGCAARGPFTIERNTLYVRESPLAALDFTKVHDVTVRANTVYFEWWYKPRVFVNLNQSTRVSVLDNVARADPRDTIVFVKADPGSDYISSGNQKI